MFSHSALHALAVLRPVGAGHDGQFAAGEMCAAAAYHWCGLASTFVVMQAGFSCCCGCWNVCMNLMLMLLQGGWLVVKQAFFS